MCSSGRYGIQFNNPSRFTYQGSNLPQSVRFEILRSSDMQDPGKVMKLPDDLINGFLVLCACMSIKKLPKCICPTAQGESQEKATP